MPVVARMRVKVKKIKKNRSNRKDWNVLRRNDTIKESFGVEVRNRYDRLRDEVEGDGVQSDWNVLQKALVDTAEVIIPKEGRRRDKPWMTEEILNLMDERRMVKNISIERYHELDRVIKRKCREKREEWLNRMCREIEINEKRDSREMAKQIREISGKRRTARSTVIKDRHGNILTEREEVLERWREYVGELYGDERGEKPNYGEIDPGPPILKEEIRKAVSNMKWRKAEGSDGVVIEMVEAAGEFGIDKITELANKIYRTGQVPESMKESEFIVIPKKAGAVECSKHRTISIMSQMGKIILKVLNDRLNRKVEETVDDVQFGFRKGMGTRNATFMLRMVMERAIEKQKDLFICFVDFEKAFDRVRHEQMTERLMELGVDMADLRVLTDLYWEQKAVVRIGEDKSEWTRIERGVRQGCVLSPNLFSLYSQVIMDGLGEYEGLRVGGRNINNIRYADDTVLIADSEEKLQRLVDGLSEECRRYGLSVNKQKTEVMGLTKRSEQLVVDISLEGRRLDQVDSFRYLGSLVSEDGRCDSEIRSRIAMGKAAFGQLRTILRNLGIGMGTKMRILRTYVWSVILFGCECWTISKEMRKRLEAAEMWFLRRMLRIPWTARRTNEEVLRRAGVRRELMTVIRRRQIGFVGHVVRGDGLEKDCLLGMIEGRRARGRQRLKFMDGIRDVTGCETVVDVLRLAEDRSVWRTVAANVNFDAALR